MLNNILYNDYTWAIILLIFGLYFIYLYYISKPDFNSNYLIWLLSLRKHFLYVLWPVPLGKPLFAFKKGLLITSISFMLFSSLLFLSALTGNNAMKINREVKSLNLYDKHILIPLIIGFVVPIFLILVSLYYYQKRNKKDIENGGMGGT